ncbi:hypothetical protein [Streptomyces sp. MAR4 CNX-425]
MRGSGDPSRGEAADDVRAAARARERLFGPDAEETPTALRGLARL